MKRWWLGVAVVLALVAIAVVMTLMEKRVVQVGVVEKGTMYAFIEERGETRLPRVYSITMPSDGRIQSITLTEGDRVERGQVVAQMHPQDLQLAVDAGQARVARLEAEIEKQRDHRLENTALEMVNKELEALDRVVVAAEEQTKATQARLELAEWDANRVRNLMENNAASEKEWRDARFAQIDADISHKTNVLLYRAMQALQIAWNLGPTLVQQYIDKKELTVKVLERDQQAAEAELAQLKLNQERGTLTSPVDGVVLHRAITNERVLAAGTLLLEIGRMSELEIEADVLTEDAVRVQPGRRVEIFGTAIGEESLRGRVARVYPQGFEKISSLGVEERRVKVIVEFGEGVMERLRGSGRTLGIGYRVRVRIFTAESDDALMVPRAALFRDARGQWQVFAVRDGRVRQVAVILGLTNNERAEILDGVNEGEYVVLAPDAALTDGTRVEPDVLQGMTINRNDD